MTVSCSVVFTVTFERMILWIAGTENEADLMTKAVSKETLLNLVDRLTGYEYYDYEPWVQWNNSDMQWTL